jgi:hypothetical protein
MNNRRFYIVSLLLLAGILITIAITNNEPAEDSNTPTISTPADNGLRLNQ